jgi:hypothetical protein
MNSGLKGFGTNADRVAYHQEILAYPNEFYLKLFRVQTVV